MKRRGRSLFSWLMGTLLMLPCSAIGEITVTFNDVIDPVPPGGTLVYTIRVNNNDGLQLSTTTTVSTTTTTTTLIPCFNPPADCQAVGPSCTLQPPECVGNTFVGYTCEHAVNNGEDCGVGDPPMPDVSICEAETTGVCSGGDDIGLQCTTDEDCSWVRVRMRPRGQ